MADDIDFDDDDDDAGNSDEWLTTFADMTTLLLVFFILLVSMSTLEQTKFEETFSSVRGQFGGTQTPSAISDQEQDGSSADSAQQISANELILAQQQQAYTEIRSYISRSPASALITYKLHNGTITLTIPSDSLFAQGSEEVLPSAEPFLMAIREIFLKERHQNINIKGYTDNSPLPPEARFKDNWELSALRAVNILKEMLKGGIEPVRLTATGLGDLEPIAPNTTEENKAKNRRVEFVLQPRIGE